MKKASMLLWVLLAVSLSMVLVIGCGGEDDPDPEEVASVWKTVYLALEEGVSDLGRAVNTLHFHVNDGTVEIQKVFVNKTKSTEGAKYILDFTQEAGDPQKYFGDAGGYWYHKDGDVAAFEAFVQDGGTDDGRFVISSTGAYVYYGAFASGAAYGNEANYWGFIIKKGTNLGDARFLPFIENVAVSEPNNVIRFDALVE